MKVIMVHNRYVLPGGEDVAFEQDAALLHDHGHEVRTFERTNSAIDVSKPAAKARMLAETVWSWTAYVEMRSAIRAFRPDVLHVHNFLPLISPSVYYASWAEHVPVVQSLHNYRLVCPAATLFRKGRTCVDCIGRVPAPSIWHACYRGSRAASLAVAAMLQIHRVLRTWRRIDAYIAVSEFVRQQMIVGGLPAEKIHVKPNCLATHHIVRVGPGEFALYVGRLSEEKGLRTLVRAWRGEEADVPIDLPLKIVGAGPMKSELEELSRSSRTPIEIVGGLSREEILCLLTKARFLVCPSEWYEPMGLVAVEALAAGVPVLASGIGGLAETIADGENGLHFTPGDRSDLMRSARRLAEDAALNVRMGLAARQSYIARYSPDENYARLIAIYCSARNVRISS